jgi:hypothetical protein
VRLSEKLVKKKSLINKSPPRYIYIAGTETRQIYLSVTIKEIQTRAFINSGIIFNIIFPRIVQRLRITS